MAKRTASTAKVPYVAYRISGEVNEKGIGYSVKKAIHPFLEHHGFEGRVHLLDPTSGHFEVILELYDNGKYDFNVKALYEHLNVSGQISDKARPNILIVPIPLREGVRIITESADHIAYQKTIGGLQKSLDEREGTIERLTMSLRERQEVIGRKVEEIKDFTKQIEALSLVGYSSPLQAAVRLFVPKSLDSLVEATTDLIDLDKAGLRDFFAENYRTIKDYLQYVNQRFNLDFKTKEEFEKWQEQIAGLNKWQDTLEGKRITKQTGEFEADKNLIQLAETSGASEELLSTLRTGVEKSLRKLEELKAESEGVSSRFSKEREKYELVKDSKSKYNVFNRIAGNAEKRRQAGERLNILAEVRTNIPTIRFYVPSTDLSSELERLIHQQVSRAVSANYTLAQEEYGEGVIVLEAVEKPGKAKNVRDLARSVARLQKPKSPLNHLLFSALGITPEIITLIV